MTAKINLGGRTAKQVTMVRLSVVFFAVFVVSLASPIASSASELVSGWDGVAASSVDFGSLSSLESALVIPGPSAESNNEQVAAPPSSPMVLEPLFSPSSVLSGEQIEVDAQSRFEFKGLDREAVVSLAKRIFHVDRPSWAPPSNGVHVVRYIGENSARVESSGGEHLVLDSTVPLRAEGSSGLEPVSLTLQSTDDGYMSENPLIPVLFSKSGSGEVSFPEGVSVAPVSAGSSEGSAVAGNQVVYANIAQDTDFMAEPVPDGAEVTWQLRSAQSPDENSLVFKLPQGVALRLSDKLPGGAEVVAEGKPSMLIPPAVAEGADGKILPVSYTISGNVLTTHVDLNGNVDFPVLVDPLLVGYYGAWNSANVWSNWGHSSSCGCFSFSEYYNLIQTGTNPGPGNNEYGEWYIWAPGAGQAGGAGITRVDLAGVTHQALNQSAVQGEIYHSNGSTPIYTFNGLTEAEDRPQPLNTGAVLSNQSIAFCAQSAGGHDGGAQPLCDEVHNQGEAFWIDDKLGPEARTVFNYTQLTGAQITYRDETPPNEVKMYNITGEEFLGMPWVKYGSTHPFIYGHDQGLGVQRFELQIPPGNPPYFTQNMSCNEPNGFSGCPKAANSSEINLSALNTGIYSLGAYVVDAAGSRSQLQPVPKIYIDHTSPVIGSFTGTLAEANNGEVGDGSYALNFEAKDGSTTAPQSGVANIEVLVDGVVHYGLQSSCPQPKGEPTSNCFGYSGSWTFQGGDYGAGTHTITVRAKDWLGNQSTKSLTVAVSDAAYQPVGPGTVNLATGDFRLSQTDVSLSGGMAGLSVSRVYDSRYPTRGLGETLGEGWVLSVPDQGVAAWQSLTPLTNGSVALRSAAGAELVFVPNGGGGYVSPTGYETDTLTGPTSNPVTYRLLDGEGNATVFEQPASGGLFVPKTVVQASGAGGINKVTYTFTKTSAGVTEPTKILAPEAAGISCVSSLVNGCRALTFIYASSTTASGERPTEWGECKDQLARVNMTAWDTSKSEMSTTAVAQYSYDSRCRLRTEWDPRISPALKTQYAYDEENHVVALTPPGEETWAFTYGTIVGDGNTGRLAAVTRPKAGTSLWNGEAPKNTAPPTISGSPIVGVKLSVSNGTWSNAPVTYRYQWLDCKAGGGGECCNTSGGECKGIPGATNPTYTATAGDVGSTLGVQVFAINGGGSVEKLSTLSGVVQSSGTPHEGEPPPATAPRTTIEYHVPVSGTGAPYSMSEGEVSKWAQKDDPVDATAVFPPDEVVGWPAADYRRGSVYYLDRLSRTVNIAQPGGRISTAEYDAHFNTARTLSPADRQLALEAGAGSAAKSELLDTKSEYSTDGSELVSTLGPQHNVKLTNGTQVLARKHTVYRYDEGAPSEGGPYRLVTTTSEGAQIEGQEEKDIRIVKTHYSGQNGLGWQLHAPTSTETDPAGLDLTKTVEYDKNTGNVTETKTPGGTSVATPPPVFSLSFGSEGTGNGQFKRPVGVATDASGHVWVNDRENNRIEKFSATGAWEGSYGTKGSGAGQLEGAWDLAINQNTGNVYVGDSWNNRIDVFSSTGLFVKTFGWGVSDGKGELEVCKTSCKTGLAGSGNGQLNYPLGMAVDSQGDIWVIDFKNNRIEEFSEGGAYLTSFGSKGSGNGQLNEPNGIAIDEGEVYVTDQGNHRVEEFSMAGNYLNQFGSEGSAPGQFGEPAGIAVNPNNGDIFVADESTNRVEEFSPAGKFLVEFGSWGTGPGHFESPATLAVNASGALYIGEDTGERVDEWLPPSAGGAHMTYSAQFGSAGSGNEQFNEPIMSAIDGEGKVWVSDFNHARVKKFSAKGKFLASYGSYGTGEGQFEAPTGIAINQGTGNVYVSDCENNRIEELSSSGGYIRAFGSYGSEPGQLNCPMGVKIDSSGNVWVADSRNNRIEEYTSTGTFKAAYGSKGTGNGQFESPSDIAISGSYIYVTDSGNRRVQKLTTSGGYVMQFGSQGDGGGQFYHPEAIATDAAGHLFIVDFGNDRVEEFSAGGAFLTSFGSHGTGEEQLNGPRGIAINAAGAAYIVDTENNRIEIWASTNQAAHDTKTIYYTANNEAEIPACRAHPEWFGLPCQTEPAAQPEGSLPALPTTTYTYNIWDEPLTTTNTSGTNTRTTTTNYDPAGRPTTAAITSTTGTALPTITDEYDLEKGTLATKSVTVEGKTTKITSVTNTLGQLSSYTDADGNTSTFSYDIDGRPEQSNDGKGTQTVSYDTTTGFLTKLVDSAAGTFTATYNLDNEILTENNPNGMSTKHTYDSTDQPTGLEYIKTTHCTEKCVWFTNSVTPSIHDQWLTQTSTLSSQSYKYDNDQRLIEVQNTPTGGGCTTRLYGYDEDTNRRSLTQMGPGAQGECTTTSGTIETHTYDEADRLTDNEVTYDAWGNTTQLPTVDAGGTKLTSTFYTNNKLATQTQNGETIGYNLDPSRRTREIVSTGKTASDIINHYASPGDSPAWTIETPSGNWTRNITGISGDLVAIQHNSETPVLQLADLHGDIIGTAALSETETKPLSTTDTSEYGVPTTSTPTKYSWLGTEQRPTELPTGIIAMGSRSYIPQLGRFLQTDPEPGGAANTYTYTSGDPINNSDPTGAYTTTITYGNLEDVTTGPGVEIPNGHDIVPGAITAPPVNLQIEEEFNANPPWNQPQAQPGAEEGGEELEITIGGNEGMAGVVPPGLVNGGFRAPRCGSMYKNKPCHHGGGGRHGGGHKTKKSCPPGTLMIPVIEVCIGFQFPEFPSQPTPGYGPIPEPIPAG